MENHAIKSPEQFTDALRKLETTDRNHADVFNELFETLINNDAFLKKIADMATEHMKAAAPHVPSNKGATDGSYLKSDGTWQVPPDTNTVYTHPENHPASMITQDATHRFISDSQKANWDGKANGGHNHSYSTITERPTGLDSGYVRTGQKSGTSIGNTATAEGYNTTASGPFCHAEGYNTTASARATHAEGYETTASGVDSHAEGSSIAGQRSNLASGVGSHAEGCSTCATETSAHAEGEITAASARATHAEGYRTTASGSNSHAEGDGSIASGNTSHAGGRGTIASGECQSAIGMYNVEYASNTDALLIVGNGSSGAARSNALRVSKNGTAYGKAAYQTSGADYAEFFEWQDKNPDGEDRRGYFVTLEGNKVRKATSKDTYILGVVSAKPVVVGNSDPDDWHGRFLTDDFGNFITEWVEEEFTVPGMEETEETYTDEEGNEAMRIVPKAVEKTEKRTVESYIVNPNFDPEQPYTPRAERPEWSPIGMLGQLIVRDDGTCKVNGYCTVADGGTATEAESGYRVIERIVDNLVKIIFR